MTKLTIYAVDANIEKQNFTGSLKDDKVITLSECRFNSANITDCVFDYAYFYNCDLRCAVVRRSSFKCATFNRMIVSMTSFWYCDFSGLYATNFSFKLCSFYNCDFSYSALSSANFTECSFTNCTFKGAKLPEHFQPGRMTNCKNVPYVPMACPEEGWFIGYKMAASQPDNHGISDRIVTLLIPEDAKRSSAGGRKCRCDKAEVISISALNGEEQSMAFSVFDEKFKYIVGATVSVPNFNENRWEECAPGIHFFINKKEALNYVDLLEDE